MTPFDENQEEYRVRDFAEMAAGGGEEPTYLSETDGSWTMSGVAGKTWTEAGYYGPLVLGYRFRALVIVAVGGFALGLLLGLAR